MTALAILAVLLALVSLRLYLRGRRLVGRLRRARSRCAQTKRSAGAALVRSVKRRAALVRVARYCRAMDVTLSSAISAGIELGRQVGDRDAAIDALTARIAELMARPEHTP